MTEPAVLALTQGDPCGIGPEILLRVLSSETPGPAKLVLVAEQRALAAVRHQAPEAWRKLRFVSGRPSRREILESDGALVVDPVRSERRVQFGAPSAEDARATLACLDEGIELAKSGTADALVTAPLNKAAIAETIAPDFRGHTDYLAKSCGDLRYGRDYLMAFYAGDLKVALLSTHVPLLDALRHVTSQTVVEALACLAPFARGPIAVAGFNPHAGEGGLLGGEDEELLVPAVAEARRRGLDVRGPESADSLFFRARNGEFDWVLALYHDQGLIAVKTLSFGDAANVTLGLPFLRTSVDHGTAYDIAGQGRADAGPLRVVLEKTLALLGRG